MSLLVGGVAVAGALAAQPTELAVKRGERLLVVAPHPDDETLGAGGLIQRVLAHGGTVRVMLVTAGDGYVEVDGSGDVFVADRDNNRIQKFACP